MGQIRLATARQEAWGLLHATRNTCCTPRVRSRLKRSLCLARTDSPFSHIIHPPPGNCGWRRNVDLQRHSKRMRAVEQYRLVKILRDMCIAIRASAQRFSPPREGFSRALLTPLLRQNRAGEPCWPLPGRLTRWAGIWNNQVVDDRRPARRAADKGHTGLRWRKWARPAKAGGAGSIASWRDGRGTWWWARNRDGSLDARGLVALGACLLGRA